MTNPFCSHSAFNLPLEFSLCQQMHAAALRRAVQGEGTHTVPKSVPLAWLREQRHRVGPDIYLAHPATVEQLFRGVTFAVYQQIEALYCSPLAPSLAMVTRIVERMAQYAGLSMLHEEAIWAMCVHLEERRLQHTNVTTHTLPATWWLGTITPDPLADRANGTDNDIPVGVVDLSNRRVLAFRIGARSSLADLRALALYDALVGARHPSPQGTGGLVWQVPAYLIVSERTPASRWEAVCVALGVRIEYASSPAPFIEEVQQTWMDLRERWKAVQVRWAIAFDSVLHRTYGSSPLRAREQTDHHFRHLIGYRRDPASLVPALRALLPRHGAVIREPGEILFDGLHYGDELLSYFPGWHVSLQRSEHTEAVIWVSLDGEILTQAIARELVRRDGSYRLHR